MWTWLVLAGCSSRCVAPYGACVVVAKQHHTRCVRCRLHTKKVVIPIIGIVMSTTAEVALTLGADMVGGRLYGWQGS